MSVEITGRHIDISQKQKDRAVLLLGRLERATGAIDEARIVVTAERHRFLAEASVTCGRDSWKAHEQADQVPAAIVAVIEKIGSQAKRELEKRKNRKGRPTARRLSAEWEVSVVSRESLTGPRRPQIVKTSRITIRPMSAEEAAVELDGSKHDFVVYRDADSERVSVMYRRHDGNYGLISPEW